MTTTAEERARAASPASLAHKALGPFIGGNRKMLFVVGDARDVHAAIAQAIREAEDAALDKAIACVSDNFVNGEGHYAIEAIRALKHNKD